jgi:hypothetical protein
MKFILSLLVVITITGCNALPSNIPSDSTKHNYSFSSNTECKEESIKSYRLNSQQKTYIGDKMIEIFNGGYECNNAFYSYSTAPFKALKNYQKDNRDNHQYIIQLGKVYPVSYENKDNTFYLTIYEDCPKNNARTAYFVLLDNNGNLKSNDISTEFYDCKIPNYFHDEKIFERYNGLTESINKCDKNKICSTDYFNMELIYGGINGSVVSLDYREYTKGMARQAFSQHLTYDLSKSKIIRYKNIKIQILDATNEAIDFKVVED